MFIAGSIEAFQHQFIQSLRNMLSPEEAGAFILVLANSLQDESLYAGLKNNIASMFREIQSKFRTNELVVTDDDRAVFQALERYGIESFSVWQSTRKDSWEIMFNPVRALRPARASNVLFDGIRRPFEANKFNFNKVFLRPEILWEDYWQQTRLRVLYNKFPVVPYHLIIVPDPHQQLPQYLTATYHDMMWQLLLQQQTRLPGLGIGYNSLGACASVNQLHFQGFMREASLPIELQRWRHNGGDDPYPMNCIVFDSAQACWRKIDEYHQHHQPYNLLYRPGRCYVLPRVAQGSDTVLPRVRGAGWIEQCGVFNVADHAELESVITAELDHCLRSLSFSVE
jgi:hypothetical protein